MMPASGGPLDANTRLAPAEHACAPTQTGREHTAPLHPAPNQPRLTLVKLVRMLWPVGLERCSWRFCASSPTHRQPLHHPGCLHGQARMRGRTLKGPSCVMTACAPYPGQQALCQTPARKQTAEASHRQAARRRLAAGQAVSRPDNRGSHRTPPASPGGLHRRSARQPLLTGSAGQQQRKCSATHRS
jgi:hypothetical protein